MKLKPGFLVLFLLMSTSCTIQEEIFFNKDFSGKLSYSINLSSVKMFAGALSNELDSSGKKGDDFNFSQEMMQGAFGTMGEIKGISNFKSQVDESGIINFSFDFADIQALNAAYNQLNSSQNMGEIPGMGNPSGGFTPGVPPGEEEEEKEETLETTPEELFNFFEVKGKELIYRRKPFAFNQEEMKDMPISMDSFQGLGDIFTFETDLIFERKVKKVKTTQTEATTDGKTVRLKMGFKDLTAAQGKSSEVIIKLK
ncbi:MAG: hypothetical protein NW226_25495 [Microscillaceae bacterium]|nr:hypothetical protein [Microscillaceae bacterium]